jgi:hypothetical protein
MFATTAHTRPPRWKESSKEIYINAVWNDNTINDVVQFMHTAYNINEEGTNKATTDLSNIIHRAAKPAVKFNTSYKPHSKPKRRKNKPGYDSECYNMKKQVRYLARRLNKHPQDKQLRTSFLKAKKDYQKLTAKKEKDHRNKILERLETLQASNPKAYWALIKELQETSNIVNKTPEPTSDSLISHYKDLNRKRTCKNTIHNIKVLLDTTNLETTTKSSKELDKPFTIKEIKLNIIKLKTGKACGPDNILNECLIYGKDVLCAPISKLFNIVLRSQNFPSMWTEGFISSIHKSGDKRDPGNYRGLTILSCLGKLFTHILNERLLAFCNTHSIQNKWQAGFRPDFRTADQTYTLKTLIKKYLHCHKKRLYVCFIDFRKAFDLVWHEGLLYKLLNMGIGGNFYHILKSMYQSSNVKVKTSQGLSESIKAESGVRQGDGISPLLFNLYINDLPNLFLDETSNPPKLHRETVPALLYADDLIVLSESAKGLQASLDKLAVYCVDWQLEVNMSKTNIIIMRNGGSIKNLKFTFNGEEIMMVNAYKYLGTIINSAGTFSDAKLELKQKGMKALFSLWSAIAPGTSPSIGVATKLFDAMIKPITLYNCEVWGDEIPAKLKRAITNKDTTDKFDNLLLQFMNNTPCEKLHSKFCKMILRVRKQTPNLATRAELGRSPLIIDTFITLVKYWMRLIQLPEDRLVVDAYKADLAMHENGCFTWVTMVKFVLEQAKLSHVWETKMIDSNASFFRVLKQNLHKVYSTLFEKTLSNLDNSHKLRTYKQFKKENIEEGYLSSIKDRTVRSAITKFRLGSHNLMIEKGRHLKLDVKERTCKHCQNGAVEDEFHAVMICPHYEECRLQLFRHLTSSISNWERLTNQDRFNLIMQAKHNPVFIGQFLLTILSSK